jgi:diguanylate cyclase (GGDEF)-like protein
LAKTNITISADHPDPGVLKMLAFVRQACVVAVAVLSTAVLCAWLTPPVAHLLPAGWELMKANTALCALFCAGSLALFNPKFSSRAAHISRALAVLVILLAVAVLFEYGTGRVLGVDTALAADIFSWPPGRMSPHTAVCFVLLGLVLPCLSIRKRLLSQIVDGLTLCLVFLILVYVAGYCFGAIHLFGASTQNRISPHTLFCLSLLTLAAFNDRARSSFFSVIVGDGIAGKTARLALPLTLILPFAVALLRGLAVRDSILPPQYAAALASCSLAMLFFCLVLLLSVRTSALEQNIRDLSLRDELTGLYNRRGFYFLAAHNLQLAHRSGAPFSVLFLDIDNLKQINDTLGHEAGSELLQEFAVVLKSTTRATDVVGRIGGDEFVVAGNASAAEIEQIVKRIEEATLRVNAEHDRCYTVGYSLGHVTSGPDLSGPLDELLGQADKIMYQAKRAKRLSRIGQAVAV